MVNLVGARPVPRLAETPRGLLLLLDAVRGSRRRSASMRAWADAAAPTAATPDAAQKYIANK